MSEVFWQVIISAAVGLFGFAFGVWFAQRNMADPYWPCGCPRDWPPHEHPRSEEGDS